MKQIPNLFTLLNLVFGCLAITFILQNGITIHYNDEGSQFVDIPEKIWMASLCIAVAAVIDFLDGFVARFFNASSEMGKQLDSLADVVTFGVAPSMIIYQFLRLSYAREENGIDVSVLWLIPAFVIAGAAAYRLAKFNLDTRQKYGFLGMPTPAAGLLVASFPLIYWDPAFEQVAYLLVNKWFLYGFIIFISWLMVSEVPLLALKFNKQNKSGLIPFLVIAVIGIISAVFLHWLSVPVIFLAYIILSLLFKNRP